MKYQLFLAASLIASCCDGGDKGVERNSVDNFGGTFGPSSRMISKSGMDFMIIQYIESVAIVNVTKDSLQIEYYKQQLKNK